MDNMIDGGDIPTMKKCVSCIQNKTEQVGEVLDLALTLIDESIIVMCICEGCFDTMVDSIMWDESIVMAVVE
tara:strand:- start:567 stop:782 length:216 start_codon:yes stop_codon:yes gene_type:complete